MQIPLKHAMGMILTGRHVRTDEAYRLGFVNEIVPAGQALEGARRWAEQMLACSPMSGIRASKYLAYRGLQTPLPAAYHEQRSYAQIQALYNQRRSSRGPESVRGKAQAAMGGQIAAAAAMKRFIAFRGQRKKPKGRP